MSHTADPYADYPAANAGSAPANGDSHDPPAPRGRSRSRSPVRNGGSGYRSPGAARSPPYRRRSPPPKRPNHAPTVGDSEARHSNTRVTKAGPARPQNPTPSNVLGVFGLSIRTAERDLEEEFNRFGRVEKVVIVYDQRTDRSRGFGFISMATVEDASRCVQELNGVDLNGRRIRVDFSVTDRPHAPTPGEYMGLRRSSYRDGPRDNFREHRRDDRERDRGYGRDRHDRDRHHDYDRYERREGRDGRDGRDDRDRDRDRDHYRDSREWRDRRSPAPRGGGGGVGGGSRYSPRRRSYSRSPARGAPAAASPRRDYDGQGASDAPPRW